MVTFYLRKAVRLLKRFTKSVVLGKVSNGDLTIDNNITVCDVQGEHLKESPETEITGYICLPCEATAKNGLNKCCSQVGITPSCLQDSTQGAGSHMSENLQADLCLSDTRVVEDIMVEDVSCVSTAPLPESSVSTVVAKSLHLESHARDFDCLDVETQCETQTHCESKTQVAEPGHASHLTRCLTPLSPEIKGKLKVNLNMK